MVFGIDYQLNEKNESTKHKPLFGKQEEKIRKRRTYKITIQN
jgi:hypothetical protein